MENPRLEHMKKYQSKKYERCLAWKEKDLKTLKKKCNKFNVLYINFGLYCGDGIGRKYCFRFDGDDVFEILNPPDQGQFYIKVKPDFNSLYGNLRFFMNDFNDNGEQGISIIGFDTEEERDMYWELTKNGKNEI